MRLFLLFLYICIAITCYGQKAEYIVSVNNIRSADTQAIKTLIEKGNELLWTSNDSAIEMFSKAEQLSRELKYYDGVIIALLNTGHAYSALAQFDKSFTYYSKAFTYSYYTANKNLHIRIYTDVATTYLLQSDYPNASKYYFKALHEQIQNGAKDSREILYTYANLAYLQSKLGRYDLAIQYLEEAETIAVKKKYYGQLGFILNNKGEAYRHANKWDKALACYIKGLEQCRLDTVISQNQKIEIQQSLLISLGTLTSLQGKNDEAINYLHTAMQLSKRTNPYFSSIFPQYLLGKIYLERNEYALAEKNLINALSTATKLKFREEMPEALQTLSAVYEATGRYEEALKQQRAYILLKDSLMNLEKMQLSRQYEVKYLTAQKDKDIAEKQLLISKQSNQLMRKNTLLLVFSLTVLLLMVLFLLMLLRYRNNQHKQRLQEEKIRIIAKEMELVKQEKSVLESEEKIKMIQALMKGEEQERQRLARELHDGIGGTLAAIQMQFNAIKNMHSKEEYGDRINKILKMLEGASSEIRETAHNLMPDVVLKHDIEEALQLYCANINLSGLLHINLQMHNILPGLDKSVTLCIYRIVQELIQNIIKHSFATEASIQITQQGTQLFIFGEDNGIGFDTAEQKNGLGLQNLRFRVQSLQGHLSIDSAPGKGTTCYIELNLSSLILQTS